MALVVKDRVKVNSTTAGTGTFTLGSAVVGFQDFTAIGDGNTTFYAIVGVGTSEWEVGIGTYTASGTTLSRDTILESSNSGSAVDFSVGSKEVFVTYPAERSIYTDAAGTGITPATASTLGVASGGTGASTLTANNVLLGNGTSAVQFVAPGSSGNVLTSNGSTWTSAAAAAFDTGTVMLFGQTAAPTGWTKDTTNYNNSGLRIVTGTASTGGSVDFTTAFASQTPSGSVSVTITSVSGSAGNTTLTTPQIPAHKHNSLAGDGGGYSGPNLQARQPTQFNLSNPIQNTGGDGAHSHPFSFSSGSGTGTFSGNAINLAVKYVDVIRATKD